MKELNSGHRQRLKERFYKSKTFDLPDYEILEMLLFLVIPRVDTKPTAKALLNRYNSLLEVLNASSEELLSFDRIGFSAVHLFKLISEIVARVGKEKITKKPILENWGEMINYCKTRFGTKPVEVFSTIYLNAKSEVIEECSQNVGTINRVAVYPREVIKKALFLNAVSVLMVHNHPSGLVRPSNADINITTEIQDGLKFVEIELLDHIIVSGVKHFSFKNSGLI